MIILSNQIKENSLEKIDIVLAISLGIYIFFSFMGIAPLVSEDLSRIPLYVFLGVTLLKLFERLSSLRLTSYSIWYFVLIVLGLFSSFYALRGAYVFETTYQLLVNIVLAFSVIQFARNYSSIKAIFAFYAISALIFSFYLYFSGRINTEGVRLGGDLFGNTNNLAMLMMLALFCVFWLLIYGDLRLKPLYFLACIVLFFVTALTGGRKYLLMPFIFLFLLIVFKNAKNNRLNWLVSIVFFVLITFAGIVAVVNIPALYNMIGTRYEGLIDFLTGNLYYSDASTNFRYLMITMGWKWFLAKPILGYGLDNYRVLFNLVSSDSYSHNNYIEMLVNLGIVGFVLYYSFYAFIIKKLIMNKNDKSGLRNFFLAFALSLLLFEVGAVTYSLTQVQIFLGMASAYIYISDKQPADIVA